MKRKAFTVVELLIVLAVVAAFAAIIFGSVGGCSPTGKSWGNSVTNFSAKCTDKYAYTSGTGDTTSTSKRVVLKNAGGTITITCDDDVWNGISNSATLYEKFEIGEWYDVTTIGWRREGMFSTFPNCKQTKQTHRPKGVDF